MAGRSKKVPRLKRKKYSVHNGLRVQSQTRLYPFFIGSGRDGFVEGVMLERS